MTRRLIKRAKQAVFMLLESSDVGFRFSLRLRYGASRPKGYPDAPWHNAVLRDRAEATGATNQARRLGLPSNPDHEKNWDSLAALDLILNSTENNAQILDAGGERYSMITPWLYMYGYNNLHVGNITFGKPSRRGPIRYLYCDITQTDFESDSFDAITCLSVIEHGVDAEAYFREMSRILKPGAVLITSTDYFEPKVETGDKEAYGTPVRVFCKREIVELLSAAAQFGLIPTGSIDLTCNESVVEWERLNLAYTFVVFSLRKDASFPRPLRDAVQLVRDRE
ncbi:MAG TPA: class I SAM-dependent methyltransferase [Rhodothermales bacterium]|nr:class I SAM-dependent methyltransferase [Rhodothermales bacterium]